MGAFFGDCIMITISAIKTYMENEVCDNYENPNFSAEIEEINMTKLAENACYYFDDYELPNYDIPEKYFDLALVVVDSFAS